MTEESLRVGHRQHDAEPAAQDEYKRHSGGSESVLNDLPTEAGVCLLFAVQVK